MPFATTWNDLDGIMPSKIINLKIKQTSEYNNNKKKTDLHTENHLPLGKGTREGKIEVGD